ncbi:KpsF/GutQ family sugar-phosphate isomerase [Pedobacter sp. BS3]|uniref:KpsF/GutQ family sugar-phosphate isomerase n=1 Tax=Pedobacter sp. BS3 TaxID=2567937 RepID=UPI0011EC84E3|nr:KpsF/GutQ family sugar-phosphate isomerase [Pedobacter sp. BS3]TZF83721.1 KpsF/GutQ family sugar-phosphate isomerase [Pedobacter sp. BS3]
MKNNSEILRSARRTLQAEQEGIAGLIDRLDADFAECVQHILKIKGRVIVTGVGKSAIIAQKIVATFNSTGTPAVYMHAGDAIHGDLGIIQQDDLVICISKSGNTPEIKVLIPFLKLAGNLLVGMVGDRESYLAKQADLILDTTVTAEACPHNLAPTTSTTAQLALGDALAVCLLECREFSSRDFARYHPGGSLGKKLYLKVGDLSVNNEKPQVSPADNIKHVIIEITRNRLGAVAVIDDEQVKGIITDGDIRRMIEKYDNIGSLKASDIMGTSPKTIDKNELAINAFELMRKNNITQLLVLDDGLYAGIVHLHDLLREGII